MEARERINVVLLLSARLRFAFGNVLIRVRLSGYLGAEDRKMNLRGVEW